MDNKRKFNLNNDIVNYVICNNGNTINSGASTVHNSNIYIKKYNRKFNDNEYDDISPYAVNSYHHYLNEIEILPLLDKYSITPKLITFDNDTLILSNCGDIINNNNIPLNWKEQIYNIYYMLKNENLYHNDITISNITVLNNKIYLIDFGWASFDKPQYPYFNLTKNIIDNSNSIFELFNTILNYAINTRLSNISAFSNYVNNDCRQLLYKSLI